MKIKKIKYILLVGAAMLLAGCTTEDNMVNDQWSMVNGQDPVGQPVLFSSGNLAEVRTRTGEALGSVSPYYHGMTTTSGVPYMAENGRFVCTMYYHAAATDTDDSDFDIKDADDGGTMTTAWLKVNNNVGNSVYWNKEYTTENVSTDLLGFDQNATIFYWQNRLTHAFLALADYNQLMTNAGPTTEEMATTPSPASAQGKLKMYPYYDEDFVTLPDDPTDEQQAAYDNTLSDNRYANVYDLTRKETRNQEGEITSYGVNTIYEQPDPILALTVMKPAGATQEANRVRLYFRHQFSQIQVNIKGADDNSADITADQIEGVQLLGVAQEGYVCNRLNADGTVGAATAKDVNLDEFSDAVLEDNKWGTSFDMFDMATEGHVEPAYDEYLPWTTGGGTKYILDGDTYVLATGTYYEYDDVLDVYTEIPDINDYNSASAYIKIEHPGDPVTYTYEPIDFYKKVHHEATPTTGYASGYLKSYDAIAFGNLWAIRITWHEGTELAPGIKHVTTFEVPQQNDDKVNLRELASGMKYVYNLELRRGTLAVIRTEILPWMQKEELVYGTDGTITN